MTSPLARSAFRRFFVAQTVSRWGDTFNTVALVLVVFELTGSGTSVAIAVAFEILPVLVLGFVAGALVDRWPRRRVMVSADLGRAVVAFVLVVGNQHLWVIYAAAMAMSSMTVFFNPAAASALPALVDEDELVVANSSIWSAAVLSQIALAPAAAALVAFVGAGPAFGVNAISFLVSAGLLLGLRLPTRLAQPPTSRLAEIGEGLAYVRGDNFLRRLFVVQGLAALSAGATSALLVVLADRHLDVGPARFGLLLAAIGVGAGLGPLVVRRFILDPRRARWLYGPHLVRGGVDVVLATSASFPLALGALAVYGVSTSTGGVAYNSVLQSSVPDRFRGRTFALSDVVWQTSRLVSLAIGGILADQIGVRAVYILGGGVLLIAGAIGVWGSRNRR